jgi:hypothetical protein
MARRPPKYSREARFRQEVKQALDDLKDARRKLREAERAALRNAPIRPSITNTEYRQMLRLLKKFGTYEPLATDLTPSRKRSLRNRWHELEGLFETSVFAPNLGIAPKSKKRVVRDLRKNYPNTDKKRRAQRVTKKGIFKPVGQRQIGSVREKQTFEGRSESVVASPNIGTLRYNRELDVWEVEVRRKTRDGLYIKERTPIAGPEVLDAKREKLRRHLSKLPPLGRNQRYRFFMNGNPPNASSQVFRTMDELFRYAAHYRKDDQARAAFLNEITIGIVQKGRIVTRMVGRPGTRRRQSVKDNYTTVVSGFRGSNYHDVDPDDFAYDMEDDE